MRDPCSLSNDGRRAPRIPTQAGAGEAQGRETGGRDLDRATACPSERPRLYGLYATLARDESRRATTAPSVHEAGVEAASSSRRRRGSALRWAPGEGGLGGLGLGGRPPPPGCPTAVPGLLRTPVCLLLPLFAQPSGLGSARRVHSLESGEPPAGSARHNSARLGCGVRAGVPEAAGRARRAAQPLSPCGPSRPADRCRLIPGILVRVLSGEKVTSSPMVRVSP